MSLILRPSTESDLPAIGAIYAVAVREGTASFELEPPDLAEMARRREALVSAGFPYIVAEREGRLVGYAYASLFRARPAYASTVEDSVYVAPDQQGRGVGRALLSDLVAACEARGDRQMVAVIGDSASVGSIALHAALGFTRAGVLPAVGYKHGRWLDIVLMQRRLGTGEASPPPWA